MAQENGGLEIVDDRIPPRPDGGGERIDERAFGYTGHDPRIGRGRTHELVGFDDHQPVPLQRKRNGRKHLAPARGERRPVGHEESRVAADAGGEPFHLPDAQSQREQLAESPDDESGVGRTSAQSGSHRDSLVQMDAHAAQRTDLGDGTVGSHAEILLGGGIDEESRRDELDAGTFGRQDLDGIAQSPERIHHRFDIMVTVLAPGNDAESDVDLAIGKKQHGILRFMEQK